MEPKIDLIRFYKNYLARDPEEWPATVGDAKEMQRQGDPLFVEYREIVRQLIDISNESRENLAKIGTSLLSLGMSLICASKTSGVSLDVLKEQWTTLDPEEEIDDFKLNNIEVFDVDPPEEEDL